MDVVDLFDKIDLIFDKELKIVEKDLLPKIKKANKKYEKYEKIYGWDEATRLYGMNKNNCLSTAYYKHNPSLFLQKNINGLFHLRYAFMLGVASREQTIAQLNWFINVYPNIK